MTYVPIKPVETRHLNPHQAQLRPPTAYETALGDAIERAFAAGHWALPALVQALNTAGSLTPNNQAWTLDNFPPVMAAFEAQYAV
jgi:hypothetical protein